MSYTIVIPSYRRAQALSEKTIAYLRQTNVDMSNVVVVLSDPNEEIEYRKALTDDIKIVAGVPTLRGQRKAIMRMFNEGDHLLQMDDDIQGVYRAEDNKKILVTELDELIRDGFLSASIAGTKLWSINPVLNPFFMHDEKKVGLYFAIGSFFGIINTKEEYLIPELEEKEDYDRTIRYYRRYGKIVRLNNFAPHSTYYKGEGGMNHDNRVKEQEKAVNQLLVEHPDLVRVNKKRKSGFPEIVFRHERNRTRQG